METGSSVVEAVWQTQFPNSFASHTRASLWPRTRTLLY